MNIASKRLMRDYIEIKNSNDINIFASPLEDDLFEWHANICPTEGMYSGIILHFILKFTENYPNEPPKIKLMTGIPHSNIIKYQDDDYYLCMDLISNFFWMEGGTSTEPYSGWSSSYTVKTIMMQLQTFLFEKFIENYDGRIKHTLYELAPEEGGGFRDKSKIKQQIDKAFHDSYNFKCYKCGHCLEKTFPKITIPIPKRKEVIIRKDLIQNNKLIPEVIEILKKNDFKKVFKQMVISLYGYQESISSCNCVSCTNLRLINNQKDISLEELLEIKNNILVSDENILWKLLYEFGYNDNLELETQFVNSKIENKTNKLVELFKNVNFNLLSLDIVKKIFNYLDTDVIINLGQTVPELEVYTKNPEFNIKRELICFYTKESFENQTLGYGINIKYFKKGYQIQSINVILDLVSKEAYENNCNHSVWNEEFIFWLPIKINNKHVNSSRKIIEQVIADIYFARKELKYYVHDAWEDNTIPSKYENNEFKPKYFLDIICKILSSMVVDMMKDNVYASVKALNGFCEFHYLLLQFIEWYPEIIEMAEQKIEYFISNFYNVNKLNYHSLGEFIILLLVSKKFKWNDVKHNFLKESEARNIRWIIKEIPDFEDNNDLNILEQVFEIVNVGKKLNLFTIYFINEIALNIQKDYSYFYGRPSPEIENEFQKRVKKIKAINSWDEYYQELNIYLPPKRKILLDYKKAFQLSKIKKYHTIKKNHDDLFEKKSWRNSKKISKNKNDLFDKKSWRT
jgi:ubiquitin-protein ligase